MYTKYIILKKNFAPIIFSPALQHCDVAEPYGGKEAVRSAGFFFLSVVEGEVKVTCFGGSTSLGGILCTDEDSVILFNVICIK